MCFHMWLTSRRKTSQDFQEKVSLCLVTFSTGRTYKKDDDTALI